jgi:hypothetical protein
LGAVGLRPGKRFGLGCGYGLWVRDIVGRSRWTTEIVRMAGVDWGVAARLRMAGADLVAAISVACGWARMSRRRYWAGTGLPNGSEVMAVVKARRDGEGRVWTVRGGAT